ncbi:beta-galactosidase [Draconibacterium orientale]|uniref:Beta-galactosidase n=1 Tax=Draconibacterium orientale TaxID=1168034 RepID=X5DCM6_9BACT|nr:glycoside hydrolase family 2 TIM barrel-domain containing protein [Draconibacterium orientale]AHW60593.1 glycoside hydrolase [Draconibacterium orientale]SET04431.1 beta-galactosidase [Draconibacterium orientale]
MRNLLLTISIFICSGLQAQNISTYTQRLNENWQFVREDLGGIWEAVRPVKEGQPEALPLWEDIELPHCFNASDAVDPDVNYYEGPGWYRTKLHIENPYENGRTLLLFEGGGQKTDVYIGTEKAGSHVGGYDEWTVDITEQLGSFPSDFNNVPLSIRCDNSRDLEMIPSDLSDFNVYGGLYRYVNLIYVPETYISQVHIQAVIGDDEKTGQIKIDGLLAGDRSNKTQLKLQLFNQQNELVEEELINTANETFERELTIKNPKVWSTDDPYLYNISIELTVNGQRQKYTDRFAFRSFRFEEKGPFYLNGERLLLRGTHRHEDHAGVAAAMTEDMIRKEMQMIKDMGANFIRLGHYQQSRIVLNLCDSLGILVWEEIPWCRGGLGGAIYQEQAKRMLTNMITQHFNHPSVIMWGLGNENDWPGDYPEFDKNAIRAFMSELNDLAHRLDSSRKTSIRRCDFCKDIVDVYSPSIWAGWYRGKYTEYKDVSLEEMKRVDRFFHAEWGASSHAGRHSEDPDMGLEHVRTGGGADERSGDAALVGGQARVSRDGDWTETYACNLFDWTLKEQETMPWLTGAAFWAFKDFSTPIRPENPVPYVNQKGVVTRDLTPKESYYVFQSYWSKKPMVHIYGHTWPVRWGKAGESRLVKVYSNCEEVELFLNGKSQGIKKRDAQNFPAAGLYWNVEFESGKNHLKAVAISTKEKYEDEFELDYQTQTWLPATQLKIEEIEIDKQYSWIKVSALDQNKVLCLDARNKVSFSVAGDVQLIDNLGTPNGSRVVQLANGVAKIKIEKEGERYSVAVQSQGLKTALLTQ